MKKIFTFLAAVLFTISTQAQTVVDIIVDSPNHNSLEAAIFAANLQGTLSGPGPFTVFAPTDAAFDAIAAGLGTDVAGLLLLPNLADILTYHVLGSEVLAADISNGQIVAPLSTTNTLKLTKKANGDVFVNQAKVIAADIDGGNGTVHVLDAVVVPFETVVDVAIDNGLTSLTTAVVTAELLPALTNPLATLTVFAPTNAAFDAIAAGLGTDIAGLLQLPNLADILTYHVLGSVVLAADISNGQIVAPLSTTNTLKLTKKANGDVFVNQAKVVTANIDGGNGVVHVLDAVVVPFETVVDVAIDNGFTSLTTAVVTAELLPALTNPLATLTVFAPTNAAFAAIAAGLGTDIAGLLLLPNLADILTYHVLGTEVLAADISNGQIVAPLSTTNTLKLTKKANGDVFVNQAKVVTANIDGGNGVVHVLDAVVVPFETVVDVAIDNGFTSLTTAVIAAELLPALTNPLASLTVFAPTDDAFGAVPQATLDALFADPSGLLTQVLLHHVAGAEVLSTDLMNGQLVPTLFGDNLTVSILSGTVSIDNAVVTMANIQASNGVVHVINAVLVPATLGMNENSTSVGVYPNPVSETLRVNFSDSPKNATYQVFNQLGSLVLQGKMNEKLSTVSVQDLQSGMYTMRVLNGKNSNTVRFIKN
jgi:uncharacterized surface protein with fasciclin (FAS1) repeats